MSNNRVKMAAGLVGSCVLCIFSLHCVASSIAQTPEGFQTATSVVDVSPHNSGGFRLPGVNEMLEVVALVAIFLAGYSLLTAGRRGWGWFVVATLFGIVAAVGKLFLSMFLEVTTDYGPPDWDEE